MPWGRRSATAARRRQLAEPIGRAQTPGAMFHPRAASLRVVRLRESVNVAVPGRNSPCPCGSGLKYKRCCVLGYTRDDVAAAYQVLAQRAGAWHGRAERVWPALFGPLGRVPGPRRVEDDIFLDWLYSDVRDDRGARVVDLLLRGEGLPRGVRAFAAAMRDSAVRLYEVSRQGPWAKLRDVLTGETMGPVDLEEGVELLAARLIACGDRVGIHGPGMQFPALMRTTLIGLIRDRLAELRRTRGGEDEWKALAPILYQAWRSYAPKESSMPVVGLAEREAAEMRLQAKYAGWLDAPSDRLGGVTPRAAVTSTELLPRVVDMLRELEAEYEGQLLLDEPAFDPSLLWEHLGIRELRDGPGGHPPPLGHETLAALIPGLSDVAAEVAGRYRDARDLDLEWTIPWDDIAADPAVHRFLEVQATRLQDGGIEPELIKQALHHFVAHLVILSNFELHLRKVFWVADDLSWSFSASSLDGIDGEALRLPFGCLAVVFTDRYALGLAERLLARIPNVSLRGRILRTLTVYLHNVAMPGGRRGIRIAFTCDAGDDELPAVVSRILTIDPAAPVVDLLAGEAPGVDDGELAPLWSCVPLRHLFHLVVHAVLEATSRRGKWDLMEPSLPRLDGPRRDRRTKERVYYLPGSLDIHVRRAIQEAKRGAVSREQIRRCLVRGYRRRANPGWKDQDERFIAPHWRGPEDGPIVERPYRLLP